MADGEELVHDIAVDEDLVQPVHEDLSVRMNYSKILLLNILRRYVPSLVI